VEEHGARGQEGEVWASGRTKQGSSTRENEVSTSKRKQLN